MEYSFIQFNRIWFKKYLTLQSCAKNLSVFIFIYFTGFLTLFAGLLFIF